ncbi:hypothetical protein [Erythrobacter sp. HL-111]|uniref:hypothetical protein n=1 Tax=Erythrobacter sp. HL-111 TaxID=1798193 RepID=UPI0006DAEB53|nr:hypothetical protein [Erythrobacter sp. HL-111]KPP96518.1 MAG: Bacterial regulatory helix-turn-helix protein, lysR family [Erythrobacteraceae bacterium HL-111]SDS06665.1 hypothetical protein SAMN04515621_0896 [Erythrobacter sp. HL-111]
MTRRADPRTTRLPVRDVLAKGGELPDFTPVPRKCTRHDGWTPQRQRDFIEALADTGSVEAACRAVDMSQAGVYHLRRQPGAESFRKAWAAALELGVERLEDVAMERALNGVEEEYYSHGELVAKRRRYNDRLLMFMLRNRAPERFAEGGAKGLNAVGKMEVERLRKEWRAEWEAERDSVTPQEIRASIDAKIAAIRSRIEADHAREWAKLSDETRAAWERFVELRDRDLAALQADEDTRRLVAEGPRKDVQYPPPPKRAKPQPPPRRTVHRLTDEGWD